MFEEKTVLKASLIVIQCLGKNVALSFRVDIGFSVWSKASISIYSEESHQLFPLINPLTAMMSFGNDQ